MITPLKQQEKHDPDNGHIGDCWKTALAMVMGRDPDDIPHFAKTAYLAGATPGASVQALRDWLEPQGLGLMQVIYPPESDLADIADALHITSPGIPFMVLGKSPRGDWGHVVVVIDGQVINPTTGDYCDPGKALDGAMGDWWWAECIVKMPEKVETLEQLLERGAKELLEVRKFLDDSPV